MKASNSLSDSLVTAIAPIIWGSTYLVTTQMLPADSPLLASAIRALPAGLLLLIFCRQLPQGVWWLRAMVLGALNIGAFFYFLFVAAYHLPGGVAALVMSSQPLIVLLIGALFQNQKVLKVQLLACATGAIGMALLVLKPSASLDPIGVMAGIAGATSMATGIVLTKKWGRPQGVGVMTFTGWQLTAGGLLLTPLALLNESLPQSLTALNWLGFAYLSLIGALVAYMIWFRGIERLPAITMSFISFASPLAATLIGYLALGERLNSFQAIGALAILGAIYLAQPRANKPSTSHTEPKLSIEKG